MNRIYRTVFNRTLGLLQVAPETARGRGKSTTVRSAGWRRTVLAGSTAMVLMVCAGEVLANVGGGGNGEDGAGRGGNGGSLGAVNGADGTPGGAGLEGEAGRGGSGNLLENVSLHTGAEIRGRNGENGLGSYHDLRDSPFGGTVYLGGGGGGGGGVGVYVESDDAVEMRFPEGVYIYGGDGGNGLEQGGGGGGGGGDGMVFSVGAESTLTIAGESRGGNGGSGGRSMQVVDSFGNGVSSSGGGGGRAGNGLTLNADDAILVIEKTGALRGGTGGQVGGRGNGPDGLGLASLGKNLHVITSGHIGGGRGALTFTRGDNRLELRDGYRFLRDVVVDTSNGATGTLVLGGDDDPDDVFNVKYIEDYERQNSGVSINLEVIPIDPNELLYTRYRHFSGFEKTGSSTWTLTGSTNVPTSWTVYDGALRLDDTRALGSGDATLDGGSLLGNATGTLANNLIVEDGVDSTVAASAGTTLTLGGALILKTDTLRLGQRDIGGTVVFAAPETQTNSSKTQVSIEGGTVRVASSSSIFEDDSTISVDSHAVLEVAYPAVWKSALSNGGKFINNNALTYEGALINNGTVENDSSFVNDAIVTNYNTFTNLGTFTNTGTFTNLNDGDLINTDTGILNIGDGGDQGTVVGDIDNDGELIFNRSDDVKFDHIISGSGSLTKMGAGTLALTATNTYTGSTRVAEGTLIVGTKDQPDARVGGAVTVNGNAMLGGSGTLGDTRVESAGILAPGNSIGSLKVDGDLVLEEGSILRVELGEAGDQSVPGVSDHIAVSGDLTLTHSSLELLPSDTPAADGVPSSGYYRLITYNGELSAAETDSFTPASALDIDNIQIQTFIGDGHVDLFLASLGDPSWQHWQGGDGDWSDTAWLGLDADVPDQWRGHQAVFKYGSSEFRGGEVRVTDTQHFAGLQFVDNGYVLSGPGELVAQPEENADTHAEHAEIRVLADTSATISTRISGTEGIIKTQAGTLILEGDNAYGDTYVAQGRLEGQAKTMSGSIHNAATVVFNQTDDGLFAGDIGGFNGNNGRVVKSGDAQLTLTGQSSLDWSVEQGALVTQAELFGNDVRVDAGASLRFDDDTQASYSGVLSGAGQFVINGTGTVELNADSGSFSGLTSVESGVLSVANTLGGTVNVESGATLSGVGAVGSTTVADGGILAPGNSIGTLTINGDLTLSSAAILDYEVGSPSTVAGPGSSSDRIDVSGDLLLAGTLNLIQSDNAEDGTAGFGYYRLLTYGGEFRNEGLAIGSTPTLSDEATYELQAGGGNVDLFIAAVGDDDLQHWQGGDGTWGRSSERWINQNGDVVSNWAGNHAVFKNHPGGFDGGTIQVSGLQSFKGLQFVDEGYRLEGSGSLQVADNGGEIRVLADSASIATEVIGFGDVEKTGSGTLVLEGNSTLDWHVVDGELVSSAERFGGNVRIGSNGTFTLGQSVAEEQGQALAQVADYAGTISGNGHFVVHTDGTLRLSGNSADFNGFSLVSAGTLLIGDSAGHGALGGSLGVLEGASLGGSGSVGSGSGSVVSLAAGSHITPGNSIGTLTINGDLHLAKGATYTVEMIGGGHTAGVHNDLIVVNGSATLEEGARVHMTPENGSDDGASHYADGSTYTIVRADQLAVNGDLAISDDYAYLDFEASHDEGQVYVTSHLTLQQPDPAPGSDPEPQPIQSFVLPGMSFNQQAIAEASFTLGAGQAVYDQVLNMSEAQAFAAMDALSGEIHASTQAGLLESSSQVRDATQRRMLAQEGNGFWLELMGGKLELDGNDNAAGFDSDERGLLAGIDGELDNGWRLGAFAGSSRGDVEVSRRAASANSDSLHAGVYAVKHWDQVTLQLGLSNSWHDVESKRQALGSTLRSDYDARTLQGYAELGYRIDAESAWLQPFVGVAYLEQHRDGFQESADSAALQAFSADMNSGFASVGVRSGTDVMLGDVALSLDGSLGWRHAFADTDPLSRHAFVDGSDQFTVKGSSLADDVAQLELGAGMQLSESSTLSLRYRGDFGSDSKEQDVRLRLDISF